MGIHRKVDKETCSEITDELKPNGFVATECVELFACLTARSSLSIMVSNERTMTDLAHCEHATDPTRRKNAQPDILDEVRWMILA